MVFIENGIAAFEKQQAALNKAEQKKIEQLESKLSTKNEMLPELRAEHVILKIKYFGNSDRILGSP